jgi:AraC-like DNA-binding protein
MNKRAYHSIVHALEAKAGLTKLDRFSLAVRHAVDGHLPRERLILAARRHEQIGVSVATLEKNVRDWLVTDLCPVVQLVRVLDSEAALIALINEHDQALGNAVVTSLETESNRFGGKRIMRNIPAHNSDPAACHEAHQLQCEILLAQVHIRKSAPLNTRHVRRLTELAKIIGVENSLGYQAALYFEENIDHNVTDLANSLGTNPRTLSRQLAHEGLNAHNIHRTCMLNRAVQSLVESKNLGDIFKKCGYSDLAHMSRSIKSACGLSPSRLQKILPY